MMKLIAMVVLLASTDAVGAQSVPDSSDATALLRSVIRQSRVWGAIGVGSPSVGKVALVEDIALSVGPVLVAEQRLTARDFGSTRWDGRAWLIGLVARHAHVGIEGALGRGAAHLERSHYSGEQAGFAHDTFDGRGAAYRLGLSINSKLIGEELVVTGIASTPPTRQRIVAFSTRIGIL